MPSISLTYFDAPGRAEPVRIALHIAGVPFEDRRLKFPEFAAAKAAGTFPLGSVPVMHVDGLALTQTGAMLRYVNRLGGSDLYPDDAMDAFIVDSVIDSLNDTLSHALAPSLFERDMAKKLEMRAALRVGPLATVFTYVDGLIARSGGPFVVGAKLSIADLVLGQQSVMIASGNLDGISPETLDAYPHIARQRHAYLEESRIAAYRQRAASS